jgi:hypothetical protein
VIANLCRRSLLLAGLTLAASAGLAFHNDDLAFNSAHWTETQTRVDYNGNVLETIISKIWIEGDNQRIEKVRELNSAPNQPKGLSYIIVRNHDKYTYRAGADKLIKTSLEAEKILHDSIKTNERPAGSDSADGKTCEIFTYDSENTLGGLLSIRSQVRECRWHGLSLKTVARMPAPPEGSGDSYITVLEQVEVDIPIDDKLFELPAGLEVEEKILPTQRNG